MSKWQHQDTTHLNDQQYQHYILQGVSRTFALTIPQLPAALELVTGNAYLLCRITDTVEDDTHLTVAQKNRFIEQFLEVISDRRDAGSFSAELLPLLDKNTPLAERNLIFHASRVIRITHSFSARQQQYLQLCVQRMAAGMVHFQKTENPFGLTDMAELDSYCYHVAGVVGEMLSALFCDYCEAMTAQQDQLMTLSVHFGQGLQMVNILKDVREDLSRGVNWLPADVFACRGVDLRGLPEVFETPDFAEAIGHLIAVTHGHLCRALAYTLLIPAREKGMRRFCLWAISLAMLTLKKINQNRHYRCGVSTKISPASLKRVIALSNAAVGHDALIKGLFAVLARGLPAAVDMPLSAVEMAVKNTGRSSS